MLPTLVLTNRFQGSGYTFSTLPSPPASDENYKPNGNGNQ